MAAVDTFKECFKLFKKLSVDELKSRATDLSTNKHAKEVTEVVLPRGTVSKEEACTLGLRSPLEWRVYTVNRVPGLLVIPNPFLACGQHRWVKRCLVDYPIKPNVCNLDAHMTRPGNGQLWPVLPSPASKTTSSDQHQESKCSNTVEDNPNSSSEHQSDVETNSKEHLVSDSAKDQDQECLSVNSDARYEKPPSKKMKHEKVPLPVAWLSRDSMLYKLRWVTLGYHYNWTSKEYSPQHRSTFPEDLGRLSSFILAAVRFPEFKAEASIVNYYHLHSTLSGHTDHSEKDLSLPLLSISLGQSALFLIGGQSKQVSPVPLLLNSGDIVIMSGPSRLAYHGIPRVLPPSPLHPVPHCLHRDQLDNCICMNTDTRIEDEIKQATDKVLKTDQDTTSDTENEQSTQVCSDCCELANSWDTFVDYLSVSRININVRQVVSENFKFK